MKRAKYLAAFILIALFSCISVSAQQAFSKEDFKQRRAAYLKKELDLTNEESARFIPLSEELMEKKFDLFREAREKSRAIRDRNNVSDEEYEKVIDAWVTSRLKEAFLEKEYYQKFKRVLPIRKVRKYQEVDMKFMRNLMDRNDGSANRKRP
jgi:Spy/CpxP family protein refolding chaperone